jgi:hypothetical protein
MPSALASQLAASASLNASLLDAHTNKRRRTESYLFTGRDADVHDLDSIHALASNAFAQLSSLSPAFTARTIKLASDGSSLSVDFDQTLFSEAARNVDRTMQSREANANLDRTLNAFLSLLGPWLMEAPTSKVLEWLVRRFRYVFVSSCWASATDSVLEASMNLMLMQFFPSFSLITNPRTLSRCFQSYTYRAFRFALFASVSFLTYVSAPLPSFHFCYHLKQQQRLLHGARWLKPWLPTKRWQDLSHHCFQLR